MRKRSKVKAQTTSAREAEDDEMDDPEVFARHKNNKLKFWRMCLQRRCQRGKACLGDDARACFTRHWAIVPEHWKMWIRFAMKARGGGATVQEAIKAGNDAQARYLELQANPDPRFRKADSDRR
jgi:hypothetical protein